MKTNYPPLGVDIPEDLEKAVKRLKEETEA